MAQKAGLNAENLTNHSRRKRMIQKLNDQEVPPTHIMQISGHKNVQSLNNYSSFSEKQQRSISNIFSSITSTRRTLAIEEREDVSLSENQESPQQVLSLLQGANIHRGTFSILINTVSQQSPNLSTHSSKPHQDGKFFKALVKSNVNGCQQVEFTHEDNGSKSRYEC